MLGISHCQGNSMTFLTAKTTRPDFCVFGKTKRTPQNWRIRWIFFLPKNPGNFWSFTIPELENFGWCYIEMGDRGGDFGWLLFFFGGCIFQKEHLTGKKCRNWWLRGMSRNVTGQEHLLASILAAGVMKANIIFVVAIAILPQNPWS